VHSRVEPDRLAERPTSPSSDNEDSPSQTPRENGKRVMRPATEAPNRRDQHLKDARALLTNWRDNMCATIYRRRPWGPEQLLADTVLTKIATWARLRTSDDLVDAAGWSPTHAAKHGLEILAMLADLDTTQKVRHAADIREKADTRKALTAKRQKIRTVITAIGKRQRAAAKALLPPKPRASRAKPKRSPKKRPSKKALPLGNASNRGPSTPLSCHQVGEWTVGDVSRRGPSTPLSRHQAGESMLLTPVLSDIHTPIPHLDFGPYVEDPYFPPAPIFFHDQFGTPLPALTFPTLPPPAFYGYQPPHQFLPGHSSSPYTTHLLVVLIEIIITNKLCYRLSSKKGLEQNTILIIRPIFTRLPGM
jgi:hypothetical protein